jgi:Putative zinc-finger
VHEFVAYLDRALSDEPLEALEAHLRECLDCCDRLKFSRQLDSVMKARLADGALRDGVEDRVRARLAALGIGGTADP